MGRTESRYRWTLITVSYNSARTLEQFWSNAGLSDDVEWITVDNASDDDSREVAQRLGAQVIPLARNQGFGSANNVGFAQSTGHYVCFVNPDVTPIVADLSTLEHIIDAGHGRLVAPQLVNPDGSLQPNGRGAPRLLTKVLHRLRPGAVGASYRRYAQPGELVEADWLMGAVVAGSRQWLATLGPWDERFFVYYEDSDLGLRNRRAGGACLVTGDACWTHGWARETTGINVRAWQREIPSMVKFYTRYPQLLLPERRSHEGVSR